jgi:hypothetical protein
MSPNDDFARSLIESGKADHAPESAVARALRTSAHAQGSASAASTSTALSLHGPWAIGGVVALAAAGGFAFAVRGGAAPSQGSPPPSTTIASSPQNTAPTVAPVHPSPAQASGPVARVRVEEHTTCSNVALADAPPTVCSKPGHREQLQLVNTCADAVDVFWVDFQCRESFTGRIEPGETFDQATFDTHPWRVRDHATHRLVKEWVGPTQPEPPPAPVALADVVIDEGVSATERAPTVCSRNGSQANVTFVNQRKSGISVIFWVDYDCHERVFQRLEPGGTWVAHTFDTHPWRVRDENGKLLVDYTSVGEDTTVYVSLP